MALILGVQYGTPVTSTTYTGIPAGTILPCGSSGALTRTLLCDGTSYPTASYPVLFAAIGYSFGGSGANFNVPDFRGRFLRGVDGSASNDPDKASRTAMNTGGNTGNAIGSVQGHGFQTHTHSWTGAGRAGVGGDVNYFQYGSPGGTNNGNMNASNANATASGANSQATANETRPVNAYVNYCIAY